VTASLTIGRKDMPTQGVSKTNAGWRRRFFSKEDPLDGTYLRLGFDKC
jgi:hypothetical protein